MKALTGGITLALLLLLTSCGNEPPRAVSFFQENDKERAEVLSACQAGGHRGDECANATDADRRVTEAAKNAERRRIIKSWNTQP